MGQGGPIQLHPGFAGQSMATLSGILLWSGVGCLPPLLRGEGLGERVATGRVRVKVDVPLFLRWLRKMACLFTIPIPIALQNPQNMMPLFYRKVGSKSLRCRYANPWEQAVHP